eukprot:7537999-Lingulodinium_polyedra.AAC.1
MARPTAARAAAFGKGCMYVMCMYMCMYMLLAWARQALEACCGPRAAAAVARRCGCRALAPRALGGGFDVPPPLSQPHAVQRPHGFGAECRARITGPR